MKIIFLSVLLAVKCALAMPTQILLMRHAEKPEHGNELSFQGWKRAMTLPSLFENRPDSQQFGKPAALYAMSPRKIGGSVRSIQTLKFISEKFNLVINSDFTREEVKKLVADIKNNKSLNGKMIIICWEHKLLMEIASELGVDEPLDWPKKQYDRIWSLSYSKDNKLVKFQNLPERLLPADSKN